MKPTSNEIYETIYRALMDGRVFQDTGGQKRVDCAIAALSAAHYRLVALDNLLLVLAEAQTKIAEKFGERVA